jgi:outer membrane protein assembly factor BamB
MYQTVEAGLSSPVVVNDVVLVTTSAPAMYAFRSSDGIPLWTAPNFPPAGQNPYSLGPAVSGNFVVACAGTGLTIYSL